MGIASLGQINTHLVQKIKNSLWEFIGRIAKVQDLDLIDDKEVS